MNAKVAQATVLNRLLITPQVLVCKTILAARSMGQSRNKSGCVGDTTAQFSVFMLTCKSRPLGNRLTNCVNVPPRRSKIPVWRKSHFTMTILTIINGLRSSQNNYYILLSMSTFHSFQIQTLIQPVIVYFTLRTLTSPTSHNLGSGQNTSYRI
jgi:hypothetical protein